MSSHKTFRAAVNNTKVTGPHVNYPQFYQLLTKFWISQYIYVTIRDTKFSKNPSIRGARWYIRAEGNTGGRTDMTQMKDAIPSVR
jgi:hypothetical protein